ncbi:rRNA adenine N-6-methyltransferase family protein [Pseudonocardia spinosispora]|uniref:rRNA adenine N-6-methyltransferase family protein n=1 Tax=Pseudonocardia spinosispora TaxID=103441 RepID=UPI000A0061E1|nr:rRNA adenine N-6-methyltransferase family protein [Pseudonocardia spinosispora]
MTTDDEAMVSLADAARDQYFLSSPEKLALLVQAADIRASDAVVEVGAGIGSVARVLPASASLTLIELDDRFTDILRSRFPHATVIQGDALTLLHHVPCDVLLSNLPREPTEKVIGVLPRLAVRTAVIATGENPDLTPLDGYFESEVVTSIGGDDFRPPQPVLSLLIRISRISGSS